jgi:hypothetical protein
VVLIFYILRAYVRAFMGIFKNSVTSLSRMYAYVWRGVAISGVPSLQQAPAYMSLAPLTAEFGVVTPSVSFLDGKIFETVPSGCSNRCTTVVLLRDVPNRRHRSVQ